MTYRKILLVEDEPSIADAVQFVLNQEGFDVKWARLIQEARGFLQNESIAFVILDIGLPDGNGMDFCKEIRQSSSIPILFLTARQEEIDRIVGLEIGADDYVTKPFSSRELAARVKVILKRVQTTNPSSTFAYGQNTVSERAFNEDTTPVVLQMGDYEVNQVRKVISWKGKSLDLSRTEYHMLLHMLMSPGQVFSRAQLMEAAWEEPGAALERTVDAHIKSLRRKIGNESGIKTHRGFGYRMDIQS